ncbi:MULTISPECIES: hypothetical protein [Streptomyces]|uniref:Uncharacterized protein n=2 Tax=Streptomyces TaxID=1883 RepID=A0A2U9P4G4_STRAS|nr:hypothetical protein [Streptomyces actuosus]AWT44393.1 hypothetical protein DMT42_20160 [Streptomyces actuosus]MBM4820435.1 hypothetical protein [Streptomyces actuosus]
MLLAAGAVVALTTTAASAVGSPLTHTSTQPTAVSAAVAPTAQREASAPLSRAAVLGVGRAVHPVVDTGIYSGPGLSTPRIGTAWAGDNVAAICQTQDSNGKRMVLGIERPGRNGIQWANTAGYLWDDDIREYTGDLPGCAGYGRSVHPVVDTGLYSAPGLSTPRIGTAWAGDDVAGVCKITDSNGKRMVLGIERPGRNGIQWANTAGYVWDGDIREYTGDLQDCGLS